MLRILSVENLESGNNLRVVYHKGEDIARLPPKRNTVRTKVYGSQGGYGITAPWSASSNYNHSSPRTKINNFYGNLAPTSALRQNAVTHDAVSKLGVFAKLNVASGISVPTQTIASGTTDVAFLLSFQEAANYCSTQWHNGSGYTDSPAGAISNWYNLYAKGDVGNISWLRTVGDTTSYASAFAIGGNIGSGVLNSTRYVRPALWVKSDIIDNLP